MSVATPLQTLDRSALLVSLVNTLAQGGSYPASASAFGSVQTWLWTITGRTGQPPASIFMMPSAVGTHCTPVGTSNISVLRSSHAGFADPRRIVVNDHQRAGLLASERLKIFSEFSAVPQTLTGAAALQGFAIPPSVPFTLDPTGWGPTSYVDGVTLVFTPAAGGATITGCVYDITLSPVSYDGVTITPVLAPQDTLTMTIMITCGVGQATISTMVPLVTLIDDATFQPVPCCFRLPPGSTGGGGGAAQSTPIIFWSRATGSLRINLGDLRVNEAFAAAGFALQAGTPSVDGLPGGISPTDPNVLVIVPRNFTDTASVEARLAAAGTRTLIMDLAMARSTLVGWSPNTAVSHVAGAANALTGWFPNLKYPAIPATDRWGGVTISGATPALPAGQPLCVGADPTDGNCYCYYAAPGTNRYRSSAPATPVALSPTTAAAFLSLPL